MANSEDHTGVDIPGIFADARIVYNALAQAAVVDFGNKDKLFGAIHDANPERDRPGETFQITAPQNTYTTQQNKEFWLEIIAASKNPA